MTKICDRKMQVLKECTKVPFKHERGLLQSDKFCFKEKLSVRERKLVEKCLSKKKFKYLFAGMTCVIVK